MQTARKVEIFWDKRGKYIKVGRHEEVGRYEDRAYIMKQTGPFVLTKPFSGSKPHLFALLSYHADYRIYRLDILRGSYAKMLGEFPLRSTALKCFGFLYSEFLSKG